MRKKVFVVLQVVDKDPISLDPVEYNGESILLEDEAEEVVDELSKLYPENEYIVVPMRTYTDK